MIIGKIKIVISHRVRIAQSDSLKKPIHITDSRNVKLNFSRRKTCPWLSRLEVYRGLFGLVLIFERRFLKYSSFCSFQKSYAAVSVVCSLKIFEGVQPTVVQSHKLFVIHYESNRFAKCHFAKCLMMNWMYLRLLYYRFCYR